ncbi:DUF6204 family protein [Kribbella sp. WER1]
MRPPPNFAGKPELIATLLAERTQREYSEIRAIDDGLLTAAALLEARGLEHRHLRATATRLEDVKIRRPRRKVK